MSKASFNNGFAKITILIEDNIVFLHENEYLINFVDVSEIQSTGINLSGKAIEADTLNPISIGAAYAAIYEADWCKRKTFNLKKSSYLLKHLIEQDENYIKYTSQMGIKSAYCSNGDLIVAMLLSDFNMKTWKNSKNAAFNVTI